MTFLIIGFLLGVLSTTSFVQTKATRTIIYAKYLYPCVEVEEVRVETSIVMPNVKGVINDPQVQQVIAGLVILMIVIKTIIEVKI